MEQCTKPPPPWRLVIAHYNEPLHWLSELTRGLSLPATELQRRVLIIHKGNTSVNVGIKATWISRRNVGREQDTFLYHITSCYHQLAGVTIFLQGDPRHGGNRVCRNVASLLNIDDHPSLATRAECELLGYPFAASIDGCPHHCGLALGDTCAKLVRATRGSLHDCRQGPFVFSTGGQFYATAHSIRRHSQSFYAAALSTFEPSQNYLYAYVWERMWARVLDCTTMPSTTILQQWGLTNVSGLIPSRGYLYGRFQIDVSWNPVRCHKFDTDPQACNQAHVFGAPCIFSSVGSPHTARGSCRADHKESCPLSGAQRSGHDAF